MTKNEIINIVVILIISGSCNHDDTNKKTDKVLAKIYNTCQIKIYRNKIEPKEIIIKSDSNIYFSVFPDRNLKEAAEIKLISRTQKLVMILKDSNIVISDLSMRNIYDNYVLETNPVRYRDIDSIRFGYYERYSDIKKTLLICKLDIKIDFTSNEIQNNLFGKYTSPLFDKDRMLIKEFVDFTSFKSNHPKSKILIKNDTYSYIKIYSNRNKTEEYLFDYSYPAESNLYILKVILFSYFTTRNYICPLEYQNCNNN